MDVLLNSWTACAINEYLALGSSFLVPRVGLAKALLVSMIRPLAATVGSLSHLSATFCAMAETSFRQTSAPLVVGSR